MEKIKLVLARKQLVAADLARLTGYKPSRFSLWFSGTGVPDLYQAARIAEKLEVPLEWLADDSKDEPEPKNELTEGERMILETVRSENLSPAEAIKRLVIKELGVRQR